MKILFITRKYPPLTGGMEKYSKELFDALSGIAEVTLCANVRGNRFLPFFLVAAAFRIITTGRRHDVIHFGDGLLAILIPLAHTVTRATVTITACGLDVTYDNRLYQMAVVSRLRDADRVICISRNTRDVCLGKGVAREKTVVIPIGITPPDARAHFAKRPAGLPRGLDSAKILCTVGRLVRRKGHEWFIREVMQKLDDSFAYIIAGDGPERAQIRRAIAERGLEGRVFLLGMIDDSAKEWLLRNSLLFIMPNIPVQGDVEGFGLVLIEAASAGLMAIASDLDGIPDAVIPGQTALLIPPGNPGAFASAIVAASPEKHSVQAAAASFAWQRIAGVYIDEMNKARVAAPRQRLRRTNF